jgi:tRNA pseudouridine38-40 synthase
VESALETLHKHKTPINGAGRTDSGVHAHGQSANFYTDIKNIKEERFVPALNGILPKDVRVLKAEEVKHDFHARFDAKSRSYRYSFICARRAFPQELRYNLELRRQPDIALLNNYARNFRGEKDFSMFASSLDPSPSKKRYVFEAFFFVQKDTLIFEITANAFLWKMVRSIVGTLLYYEERKVSVEDFKLIVNSEDRLLAGPTAPPEGLSLWKVSY